MESYRARWVVPVESAPIEDGCLVVENGVIVRVANAAQIESHDFTPDVVHDLGESMILPGFINAHTHLELTCYRGQLERGSLWQWIDQLVSLRQAPDGRRREQAGIRQGVRESLAAGVTCVGDISRTGMAARILSESPIRKVCYVELISGAAQPPNDCQSLREALREMLEMAEPDRLLPGISPHTLYTVSPADLKGAAAFADAENLPLTMHLLETRDESDWLSGTGETLADFRRQRGWAADSPWPRNDLFNALDDVGVMRCAPLLAHVNYITPEQIARLATWGASVAWCPRAHAFFGHSDHPWRDLLALGVNVCVGTDSAASNASLSILDELRSVRTLAPTQPPDLILELGTIRAARALRLERAIGSLKEGKRGDFIRVPLDPQVGPDPASNLLDGGGGVEGTWIDGSRVF